MLPLSAPSRVKRALVNVRNGFGIVKTAQHSLVPGPTNSYDECHSLVCLSRLRTVTWLGITNGKAQTDCA